MKPRLWALPVAALAVVTGPAAAHSVFGLTGFSGGLLHPVFIPAHLMPAGALALLIGPHRCGHGAVGIYALGVAAGLGAIALAYVPTGAEEALLALASFAGLLVAADRRIPTSVGGALAGATGLAIGLDSPPETISIRDANLTLLGTAVSAPLLLAALVVLTSRIERPWQRIGARILGSWIAASAILELALRLAK